MYEQVIAATITTTTATTTDTGRSTIECRRRIIFGRAIVVRVLCGRASFASCQCDVKKKSRAPSLRPFSLDEQFMFSPSILSNGFLGHLIVLHHLVVLLYPSTNKFVRSCVRDTKRRHSINLMGNPRTCCPSGTS
jgi:hypothetical protein